MKPKWVIVWAFVFAFILALGWVAAGAHAAPVEKRVCWKKEAKKHPKECAEGIYLRHPGTVPPIILDFSPFDKGDPA